VRHGALVAPPDARLFTGRSDGCSSAG
jgi:hypothetical protein